MKEELRVLKSQMKELLELPNIVCELQARVQRMSKDLEFMSDSGQQCVSTEPLKVAPQKATASTTTPLPLTNRFAQHVKEPTNVRMKANSRKNLPKPNRNPHGPSKKQPLPPTNCPDKDTAPLRQGQTNVSNDQQEKKYAFYIRKVPKNTSENEVHAILEAARITPGYLKPAPTIWTHASRKYLEVSLSLSCANRLDKFLKANTSLDWFISVSPPKGAVYSQRNIITNPRPYNQPITRTYAHVLSPPKDNPSPINASQQPFRPIPPLMALP